MPLPDAKPDRRIYELLKTTDLENLTFSDFQGVAEKVYAEQGAEDTLRRIVLVNLARLAVVGEWTGLTDAGGGSPGQKLTGSPEVNGNYTSYNLAYNPMGTVHQATGTTVLTAVAYFVPFVAPRSATVNSLTLDCSTAVAASTVDIGLYSTTDDGGVGNMIAQGTIDTSATGLRTQTSLSATLTFEKGSTYWIGWVQSAGASFVTLWSTNDGMAPLGLGRNNVNTGHTVMYYYPTVGSATSLPSGPFTATDWTTSTRNVPCLGFQWS